VPVGCQCGAPSGFKQVVRLVDLLDEAKARCQETIKERRTERNEPISDEVRIESTRSPLVMHARL
jgi:hypothetical protein